LHESGFAHGFPEIDAHEGDLAAAVGVSRIEQVKQVHGCGVVVGPVLPGTEADAIIARAAAAGAPSAVGVRVADCVPVLVGDLASGDVAAIHAGWRGVVAGVVGQAIARLQEVGQSIARLREGKRAGPGGLVAAIGPCIGPCCFEVGRDVADTIARVCPDAPVVVAVRGDKAFVDLRAAVRSQLRAAAPSCRIEDVAGCTKHEPERFHSFRRDGANSGRMLAAIAARPARAPATGKREEV
jgi:YfiH family protein